MMEYKYRLQKSTSEKRQEFKRRNYSLRRRVRAPGIRTKRWDKKVTRHGEPDTVIHARDLASGRLLRVTTS